MKFLKTLMSVCLVLMLAACVPQTQMIQDGHEWIQLTQSYNIWGANVVKETHCHQTELRDGFCYRPQGGNQRSTIMQAPGPWMAGYVLGAGALVASAGLIKSGMENHAVPQQASPVGPVNVSTWNQGLPKGNW